MEYDRITIDPPKYEESREEGRRVADAVAEVARSELSCKWVQCMCNINGRFDRAADIELKYALQTIEQVNCFGT